ncbi:ATP-binding protein [Tomitella gaofuii]|uniref:ATP-binding protein n=1 Tax=Tomitella gaofuii TaxID=2760083 RepID=UPI0015FC4718|nr:ATP-binding protein [Tomitella gaofuii]
MQDKDVVDVIKLKPDAGFVESVGVHRTLSSALADLVDNGKDAGADRLLIRLLTKNDRLVTVETLDNGCGMNDSMIDSAMTLGYRRIYATRDLGHFGIGMKAALQEAECPDGRLRA